MSTLVAAEATTSTETRETASTARTLVATSAEETADGIATPSLVESTTSVTPPASETTEIIAISRQINCALECPICLTLMSAMSCFCPNGHAVCQPCMQTLFNTDHTRNTLCPLCRTSMEQSVSMSAIVKKLVEVSRSVKVACSNQSLGCPELVPVLHVSEHESVCRYVAGVKCQVGLCQWVGMYEQLYEHVLNMHPGVAVQSSTNRLMVTDVKDIKKYRSRTYLVQSTYGMIWVLLSRTTRSRIQAGLFMVDRKWSGRHSTSEPDQNFINSSQSDILYRITWFDDNDRARTRSRTKVVNWSTTLKEASHALMNNAYSMFRSRKGSMEISWFPSHRHNNNHRTIL